MSVTIDGTNGVTFPDATVQAASAIGVGQTWQNVTRTAGTTYTNSTGRPIFTQVTAYANTTQYYSLAVSGVNVAYYQGQISSQIAGTIGAIVPPGATYVFTVSGSASIYNQIELR
jgi:hypothetical protein